MSDKDLDQTQVDRPKTVPSGDKRDDYSPPKLVEWGRLADIVKSGGGSANDGFGTFGSSGST